MVSGGFYYKGRKFSRLQSRILTSVVCCILLSLCIILGYFNAVQGKSKSENGFFSKDLFDPFSAETFESGLDPRNSDYSGLILRAKITNIDIPSFSYSIHYSIFLSGNVISEKNIRAPLRPMEITFGNSVRVFPAARTVPSVDVTYAFSQGGL